MSARPLVLILDDFSEDIATLYRVAGRLTLADARRLALSSQNGSPWAIETSEPAIGPLSVAATAPNSPTHGDWTLRAFHQALREPDAVDLVLIDLDASDGESLRASLQTILGAHTDAATGEVVPTLGKLLESLALPQAMTPTVALAAFSGGLPSNEEAPGLGWLAANAGSIVQPAPNVGQPALNWAMSLPDVVSVGAVDAAGALRFAAGDARTQVDVLADGHVTDPQWGEQFGTSFAAARVAAHLAAEPAGAVSAPPRAAATPSVDGESLGLYSLASATGSLGGVARFWAGTAPGEALSQVALSLSAAAPSAGRINTLDVLSDAGGNWSMSVAPNISYQLEAARVANGGEGAVTARDALAALKLALGRSPNADPDGSGAGTASAPSIHQLIAADVNRDGSVTTADAQAILTIAAGGPSAIAPSWRLIASNALTAAAAQITAGSTSVPTVPDIAPVSVSAGSTTSLNHVGVLLGDVDGSWRPNAAPDVYASTAGPTYETGASAGTPNKASSVSLTRTDTESNHHVLTGWSAAGSVTFPQNNNAIFDLYTREGNFGTATLHVFRGANALNDPTSYLTYSLNDTLAETNSLSASQTDYDRFIVSVTDGKTITSTQLAFTVGGADDATTWETSPTSPTSPITIYRTDGARAIVRIDAVASDPDSTVSYQAALKSADGQTVATAALSASGGSLIGVVTWALATPDASNYTLTLGATSTNGSVSLDVANVKIDTSPFADSAARTSSDILALNTQTNTAAYIGGAGTDIFEGLRAGYAVAGGAGVDSVVLGATDARTLQSATTFQVSMLPQYRFTTTDALVRLDVPKSFADTLAAGPYQLHQAAALQIEVRSGASYAYTDAENIVFTDSAADSGVQTIDRAFTLRDQAGRLELALSDLSDRIVLGVLADNVSAGAGNDVLIGRGNGNGFVLPTGETYESDLLRGGAGDDILTGGSASQGMNDFAQLFGDAGDDVLVAVAGRVEATGGTGRDLFSLWSTSQSVKLFIQDFNAAVDAIDLSTLLAAHNPAVRKVQITDRIAHALASATEGMPMSIDLSPWMASGAEAQIILSTNAGALPTLSNFAFADPAFVPSGWRGDIEPLFSI